jgi:hypothetical protein
VRPRSGAGHRHRRSSPSDGKALRKRRSFVFRHCIGAGKSRTPRAMCKAVTRGPEGVHSTFPTSAVARVNERCTEAGKMKPLAAGYHPQQVDDAMFGACNEVRWRKPGCHRRVQLVLRYNSLSHFRITSWIVLPYEVQPGRGDRDNTVYR